MDNDRIRRRRRARFHLGAVAALFLAAAGGASASCSSSPSATPPPNASCTTPAANALLTDTTGQTLAQAYRAHAPTPAEMQYAAAFLVLLSNAAQTGTLDATLFETDILPQLAYLASSYPSLFQPCTLTPTAGSGGSAPQSLKPLGFDCSQSCFNGDELLQLGAKAAGWAALKHFYTAQAANLAGLDETMSKAVGEFLTSGMKSAAAAGQAAIAPIPLGTDIQLLEAFGTAVDVLSVAAAAGVLLGITTEAALAALGTLSAVILADQIGLALVDAWDSYQSCEAALERNCQNPPPLDTCVLSNGTVGDCAQPSATNLCTSPLDPTNCNIPRIGGGGGNPIEDDGGTPEGGLPGDGAPPDGPAPEVFVSTTYDAPMSSVSDSIGCQYGVSASGQVTFDVVESNGVVTGTATTPANIDVVATFTPPNDTCTGNPFTATMSGDLSGNDASLGASLATSGGSGTFVFTGTRSGSTITGTATIRYNLVDGSGAVHPSSGVTGTITATKQ